MPQLIKYIGIVIVGGLLLTFGLWAYNSTQNEVHPQSQIDLPPISQLAYKKVGHNLMHETLYVVYDIEGYANYVTESQFNNTQLPQKIGDSLYKMPDGSYLTGLIK